MKKTLMGMLLAVGLAAAGCGSDNDLNLVNQGPSPTGTLIPSQGGEVPLPSGPITGSMLFDAGADPQTLITVSASTSPPLGVSLPHVGLTSPQATTVPFYHLVLRVSRPTPLSLLEGVRLTGAVPGDHEHYHADLFEIGGVRAQGQQGSTSATFMQEFPGEHRDGTATFDELVDGAILQPDKSYAVRFKSTDQQTLALSVQNDSGKGPMYVMITGRNPNLQANDPRFYHVNAQGQLAVMDLDDLENGFADYSIPVGPDGSFRLPLISAGRVYVSLGEKMKTQLNPPIPGDPNSPPAFWVAPSGWSNANEPNYKTLFDWVEFDYKVSPDSGAPGMGINKTEVQMVSLPFTISMTSKDGTVQTVGAKEGARTKILEGVAAHPAFAGLIVDGTGTGTDVSPIRVISPDNGIYNQQVNIPGVPRFPLDYYDSYIDEVWEKYKTEDLTMVTSACGTYLGRVNQNNEMVFTQTGKRSVTIPKPTSSDVIIGNGALIADVDNATTTEEKNIVREHASTMSACFNRSTLLVFPKMLRTYEKGAFDPSIFYQATPTNIYSKVIHENSLPTEKAPLGAAYGFGFDDNLDQSSFIGDNDSPTSVTITVTKF